LGCTACDGAEIFAIYSRKFDTGTHFAAKSGIKTVFDDYIVKMVDLSVLNIAYIE
jgi:hypothetical protein